MTDRSVVVNRASTNTPPVCIVCGGKVKQHKDGRYPKTCSMECLQKIRSINSSKRSASIKATWNRMPLREDPEVAEIERRDSLDSILRSV